MYDKKLLFSEAGLLKLNCDKAAYQLGWAPSLNFEETIQFTSTWYNHFYKKKNSMTEFTSNQIIEYSATARSKKQVWAQ